MSRAISHADAQAPSSPLPDEQSRALALKSAQLEGHEANYSLRMPAYQAGCDVAASLEHDDAIADDGTRRTAAACRELVPACARRKPPPSLNGNGISCP